MQANWGPIYLLTPGQQGEGLTLHVDECRSGRPAPRSGLPKHPPRTRKPLHPMRELSTIGEPRVVFHNVTNDAQSLRCQIQCQKCQICRRGSPPKARPALLSVSRYTTIGLADQIWRCTQWKSPYKAFQQFMQAIAHRQDATIH